MRKASTILTVVILVSCGGEFKNFNQPSSTQPVTLLNGSMSASVNGTSWNADASITTEFLGSRFSIFGSDKHAWLVSFSTTNPAVGTQSFTTENSANCTFTGDSKQWDSRNPPTSGEITFTTFTDHSAIGTFKCTGGPANSRTSANGTLTNGTFNVTF